jgi:uncharacterized protein YjiK
MRKHTSLFGMILILLLIFYGCGKDDPVVAKDLTRLSAAVLIIPETSGLSYYKSDNTFLTVSDSTDRVYVITKEGEVLDTLSYDGKNLEGVAYDAVNSRIFVVEEHSSQVVQLDTLGNEKFRFTVDLDNTDPMHGLEGITYNPLNGHLYVVSEKTPSILFEMNTTGELVAQHDLGFMEDYSSVFFDKTGNNLWILSDQSEMMVKCDMEGKPLEWFYTGIKDGEGSVVDVPNSRMFIVTDSGNTLFTFSF